MLRSVVRLVLVVIVVVAALAFFVGYRWAVPRGVLNRPAAVDTTQPTATTGHDQDSGVARARETGAAVGETVAVGAERAGKALDDARLTAKIKSKIALDDTLKGTDVSVSTTAHVVTLNGSVANDEQHRRVLSLARETEGVASVDDHLGVRP